MINAEDVKLIVTLLLFAGTVIAWAVKYGGDQQKLKSKNDIQDLKIDSLQKQCDDEKIHNAKQHEEFYENKNATIEIKSDMKHIMSSLEDIKGMLSTRKREQ